MPFNVTEIDDTDVHHWAVVETDACNLSDPEDRLIGTVVTLLRTSYGETRILELAELVDGSDEQLTFDVDHLRAAIRLGLPDPEAEGRKPPQLTVYRSQSAEMVAKGALARAFGFIYPAAPQQGSLNANQPILGFDSWGLANDEANPALVLIQVKATDEAACPPAEAANLVDECRRARHQLSALSRTLAVLIQLVDEPHVLRALIKMLEALGAGRPLRIVLAPVIVRGVSAAQLDDLRPLRDAASEYLPAVGRGIVVRIGVPLADFGRVVMNRARGAA